MPTHTIHSTPEEARRRFGRVLAGWAGDTLRLRQHGLDRPSQRDGRGFGVAPSGEFANLDRTRKAA